MQDQARWHRRPRTVTIHLPWGFPIDLKRIHLESAVGVDVMPKMLPLPEASPVTYVALGDSITAGYFPDVAGILDGRAPAASCYDAGHTGGLSSIAGVILGRFGSGDGWCGTSLARQAQRERPCTKDRAACVPSRE